MGLIKTADQILQGRPRPVDVIGNSAAMGGRGRGGRPAMYRECTLPDCEVKHHANGYCQGHWHRWARWGSPYHVFKRAGARGSDCECDMCLAGVTKRTDRG